MKEICPNLHNKQVAKEFGELKDLFGEDTAYLLWSKNNGYSIDKAPNGADSILFGELLHVANGDRTQALILKAKVYSDEFIKWFGDWTSEDKRFKNANIIWGYPGTGKTWMFEHGAKNIIDFDSEYKSKIGNLKEREQLKKKIGKSEYNKKLDELFDEAKQEALKSGKKLLVSDMHFLKNRSKDLDIVTNISDQEFIQRSHQRGEHNEADKIEWKNSINYAMKNIPESKVLNTTGYISDLFARSNVSKIVDKNGEPQVTYHTVNGRYNPNFNKFDTNIEGIKTAIYHTDSYQMSATYNPVSQEKEEGNRLGYYYNEDNLPYTKVDYLNIKNPKVIDANGSEWRNISTDGIIATTRDIQDLFLFRNQKTKINSAKNIIKLISANQITIKKIREEIRSKGSARFGKFRFFYESGGISVVYNNELQTLIYFGNSSLHEEDIFKRELINFAQSIVDSVPILFNADFDYDGVVINNVIDYGARVENPEPHTVYECIDNSQVKSVFNNGQFANPDDMYASPQGESNMGASSRLSNIPSKGDISVLQQYLKSHRNGVSGTALKLVMAAVNRYFNDKQTGITYEIVDKLPGGEAAHYDRADNVIRINKNARFRNESKSQTPEVQTIVHEMLHAVTEHAIYNDSRIRKSFTDLYQKTKKALGKDAQDYGLSDVYEFVAELSNAQFVEKLKSIQYNRKQTLFEKIKQAIKKIYSQIFTSYKDFIGSDNVYEAAVNDLFAVMSHNKQNEDNITDNEVNDRLASIQASEDKVNQIHHRITELFQGLYKDYKKQLNKGANRQRREDQVWSTIQELKSQEKKESSRIAIQSALKTIGVFARDPIDNTILQARRDTILGFLQECQKNNFDSLTAEQIHDMKSNIIDFYNDLVKTLSDNQMDLDARDQADVDTLNATVRQINQLWKDAAQIVADKIVDENVDKYINESEEERNKIKAVAKDWLHKNDMYGDESKLTLFFNYSRQNSPIIRQAFQMIQDADQQTRKESLPVMQQIAKAFDKANSIIDDLTPGNWQTMLMERYIDGPKKGEFTGLFRSAVNRGQFKQDQENFKEKLNKEWQDKYGYFYYKDPITGETLRSDTESSVEEEQWLGDQEPNYVTYQRKYEEWLCDHARRRYSKTYFMERLSKPYDSKTRTGHGLSPRTLSRQQYIQDQLNYLLQKCSDKQTGLSYPEKLNPHDYQKLQMWKDALQDLGNPFDQEGNLKEGDELQTALEIQSWNNWLAKQTDYSTDFEEFDKEYQNIVDQIKAGEKTTQDLYKFIDANSEYGINPEYLEYIFGKNKSAKESLQRMFQNSMKRLIKTKNGFVKDFSNVIFSEQPDGTVKIPDMWFYSRSADIKNNEENNATGIDPEEFRDAFDIREVPYTDPSGMQIAKDGVTKFDPRNNPNGVEPMSWFEYILKQYTDAALDGRMPRYVSLDGKIAIDFSTLGGNRQSVERWIAENILMYTKTWEGNDGSMKSKQVPLTIFSQIIPKRATFGNNQPTSRYIPKGRFTTKKGSSTSSIYDDKFYDGDRSGLQPDFDKYGDKDFVKFIQKGDARAQYYNLLVQTMEQQWDKLGLDPSYNRFKLPQMEGTSSMKRYRSLGSPKKFIKNKLQNATGATSDDTNMRDEGDFVQRNGKWVLKTAPTRFINEMEDPSMISSDLAYTVGMFINMANNFVNKSKVQAKLETLGYNLSDETRDSEHQGTGTRQQERYAKMLKQLFYESRETNDNPGEKPSKKAIAAAKLVNKTRGISAYLMLAANVPSMFVGVWDSFTQMPAQATRNDQFGFRDLMKAYLYTGFDLMKALANIGNPIANCKAVAMMQKDGLVRTNDETFKDTYRNRITKVLKQSATGGYTIGDYMMNMLAQRATYNAKKYYPGNTIVKEGFYTKTEFDRLMVNSGLTQKEVNRDWKDNHGESMWNAYYFDHGIAKIKPSYADVQVQDSKLSATIQQTMSLLNGNSPKNDQSAVSNNVLHKFFFLMRNFFIRRAEHWFAGYTPDNVVRQIEQVKETVQRGSTTTIKTKTIRKPLTNEQKAQRCMYDYSTGEANPAVLVNLMRGAHTQLKWFNQYMFNRQARLADPVKFNKNEVKSLREFLTWGICLALLSVGWMAFHRYVQEDTKDLKPKTYEDSLPTIKNFIDQKIYLRLIDQCMFRTIDSQFQLYNVYQFVDMVKSATTVTSAVEKFTEIPTAIADAAGLTGNNPTDIISSDSKYKYFPRWQRSLMTASGVLNNIQTWGSSRGNDKVGRWYFDNTVTGTVFKMGGYTWKDGEQNNGNGLVPPPPPPAPVAPPPPPPAP